MECNHGILQGTWERFEENERATPTPDLATRSHQDSGRLHAKAAAKHKHEQTPVTGTPNRQDVPLHPPLSQVFLCFGSLESQLFSITTKTPPFREVKFPSPQAFDLGA